MVKVWLRDGSQRIILLNLEIEGGNAPLFPQRVWEYNYRVRDRYGLPVATIVVYTGNRGQSRPSEYITKVLDTSIHFRYRSYHIFDHKEEELLVMDNIFALIVVACQKALLEGKVPEDELGEDRNTVARALLSHGKYDNDRIISFLVFLKNFIYIKNQKINRNFNEFIHQLTGGIIDMGIIETVKLQERREVGLENQSSKKMLQSGFDVQLVADILDMTVEQVEKLK